MLLSLFAAFLFAFLGHSPAAQSVTLAWDANSEPDIAGYIVHYGTASGVYTQASDVGNATTGTISNLADGVTYFMAVTAYNSFGLESPLSDEATFAPLPNQPPSVNLTSPSAGGQFTAPANIVITASANDGDGSIGRVEFYNGASKIGEVASGPYTFVWNGVSAGTYALSAIAFDDLGAATQSAAVNVTVNVPAPAVVTGFSATAASTSQINLSWTASSGASSYNVKRSNASGGPYTSVAAGVTATSYANTGLSSGSTYYYVVSAVNAGGESANSTQAAATTLTLPPVPAALTATAGDALVRLAWTAASGAVSYNVKRSTTSGGPYTTVATGVTAASYTNTGLNNGSTYFYVVSAVNASGEGANSAQVGATPLALPPVPTGLTATAGNAQAALSWTVASGAVSYNVKRSATSGGPYTTVATGVTATSYTDTGLNNGSTYYYVVSAINAGGESANSAEAAATPFAGLPSPWTNRDIGSVGAVGTTTYNSGTFTIDGSGADISGRADEFQYVYQTASGDCSIVARIATIENTNAKAKSGIMIREATSAKSRHAAVLLTPGTDVQFARRTSTGGTTAVGTVTGITTPRWLKLTRTGNIFRAYHSADGVAWTQFGGDRTITMGATVTIGMVVSSRADGVLCTSTMDSVTASP